MDVYGVAKLNAAFDYTLWEQAVRVATSLWNREGRVPDTTLLNAVELLQDEQTDASMPLLVGASTLLEVVPGLTQKQAEEVILKLDAAESNDDEQNLSISDALGTMNSIKNTVVYI